MKLTNLTKSVLTASALTVASFGANASLIGSAVLDVENFAITTAAGDITPDLSSFLWQMSTSSNYLGELAGGTANSVVFGMVDSPQACSGPDCNFFAENDYGFGLMSLANNVDFASSDALVDLTGQGAHAQSRADIALYNDTSGILSTSGSSISNTISADITFDLAEAGEVSISFDWMSELIAQISADWLAPWFNSEVSVDYSLSFSIDGIELADCFADIESQDCANYFALGGAGVSGSDSAKNEAGQKTTTAYAHKSTALNLDAGTYTLSVAHVTNAKASHIPEPTTLAVFGLGLLGLAGAARRRKS